MQTKQKSPWLYLVNTAVLVAALGYFVDIYDLLLFSIVRVRSLTDIGLTGTELTDKGLLLINIQMAGLLIGGVVFGILGDKKGRLSILFGSILLYSIANVCNGFVQSFEAYAILRFLAGIGLAGELGAGISLVSETLPKEARGLGTMIVATVGLFGAVFAWTIADNFTWRTAYFIGGGGGLLLLAMRIGVYESGIYTKLSAAHSHISRGNFISLFTNWNRFKRYISNILMGIQFWFMVGILITLSPEFAKALGIQGKVEAGKAVVFCYLGLAVGDVISGVLSYLMKSRKKVLVLFLCSAGVSLLAYFTLSGISSGLFYGYCFLMGILSGYWALFVTVAAENFGTNIRATVATTVPNFVRGSLIPISALFTLLKASIGILHAGIVVALVCISISVLGISLYKETYSKDLDYLEN